MHNLTHQHLDDVVHRHQPGAGLLNHPVRVPLHGCRDDTGLTDQRPHFSQDASQNLAFFRFVLGKEMVFFDRAQNRFRLLQGRFESLNPPPLEPPQCAATALRQPSQDARFVGIVNGQFLGGGVRRDDPLVDKAKAMGLLDN
jgi:hypothetical protein